MTEMEDYERLGNFSNSTDLYYYSPGHGLSDTRDSLDTLTDSFYAQIQKQSAFFGIALTLWTFIINVTIATALLSKRATRRHVYYIQIVNFSLVNILISMFVIPLTVYYILEPWNLGGAMCKVWVIFDVLLPCLSMLILIILSVDRLLVMRSPKTYTCCFQKCLTQVVLVAPWLVSVVIVVPLWTHGTLPYEEPGECVVIVSMVAAIACPILTYFVPLLILAILTLLMLFIRVGHDRNCSGLSVPESDRVPASTKGRIIRSDTDLEEGMMALQTASTESLASLCLVNLFFAIMWFPFQCLSFILSLCSTQVCVPSLLLKQALTWMGTASAGVLPLLWFLDGTIRSNVFDLFCCRTQIVKRFIPAKTQETYF